MLTNKPNMIPTNTDAPNCNRRKPQPAIKMCKSDQQKGRRKFQLLGIYTILIIVLIELVLINPDLRPVEAGKKKKIIKKIKEILPLIALLKRKKIVLLPIPM